MAQLMKEKFRFTVDSMPGDAFSVVRFDGVEGLSRLFEFSITLVSKRKDIDMDEMVQSAARFVIVREESDVPFPGIIKYCEQLSSFGDHYFYRVVLVPKLWWLTLTHHNQVFLDKTVPQIIENVLEDGGLTSNDYELRLQRSYSSWEYVCQYGESHFDFFSRWLEREGMYFFFEEGLTGGKVVVTDTKISHSEMKQGAEAVYAPPSGLEPPDSEEIVKSFVCRQQLVPSSVRLKDYNYRTPSLDLSSEAKVAQHGRGAVYMYGDHVRTKSESDGLAKVRAEEYLCRERQFFGESSVPFIKPGFLFKLKLHFRDGYNQEYLTISMEHRGSQAAYLVSGLQLALSDEDRRLHYDNSFTAIPSPVQFRSERNTERPRFNGVLSAKIDAASSGEYAEIDDQGRYKVILPFDVSGRSGGKASAWIRMAQPYAGANQGMHFPLHKGTEVLLTFVEGDPDRPIIASAAPNPETQSPVTNVNSSMSKIATASGNTIHLEDKEGSERILLNSPKQDSFMRVGAINDPPTGAADAPDPGFYGKDGINLYTSHCFSLKASNSATIILGSNTSMTGGADTKVVTGLRVDTSLIARQNFTVGILSEIACALRITCGPVIQKFWTAAAKVEGTKMATRVSALETTAQKTQLLSNTVKAIVQETKAIGSGLKALGNQTRALGSELTAIGDDVKALGQHTTAIGGMVEALGGNTTAIGVEIKALGNETKAIGQYTKTVGVFTESAGQKTSVTGSKIESTAQTTLTTANFIII